MQGLDLGFCLEWHQPPDPHCISESSSLFFCGTAPSGRFAVGLVPPDRSSEVWVTHIRHVVTSSRDRMISRSAFLQVHGSFHHTQWEDLSLSPRMYAWVPHFLVYKVLWKPNDGKKRWTFTASPASDRHSVLLVAMMVWLALKAGLLSWTGPNSSGPDVPQRRGKVIHWKLLPPEARWLPFSADMPLFQVLPTCPWNPGPGVRPLAIDFGCRSCCSKTAVGPGKEGPVNAPLVLMQMSTGWLSFNFQQLQASGGASGATDL